MKLRLEELGCKKLLLESGDEPKTTLHLSDISEGTGELDFRDGLTILHDLAIRSLLAQFVVPVGEGEVRCDSPASFSHLTFDGRLRNGLAGELRSSVVSIEALQAQTPNFSLSGEVSAEGLLLKLDGRGGRIEVGTLTFANAHCTTGAFVMEMEALSLSGLKAQWSNDRDGGSRSSYQLATRKSHARNLQVTRGGEREICVRTSSVDLPEGFSVDSEIRIPSLVVDSTSLEVQLHEDAAVSEELESADEFADGNLPIPSPIELRESLALDHGVFDTLNGHLSVDVTAVVTLPVIGRRNATHYFRMPVEGGMISVDHFEDGLAGLEDAFLDIRLRDDRLVLERDIPLIPGLDRPLVIWNLSPGERELASKRLVRLRTLMGYEIAVKPSPPDSNKKSKANFHGLDLDNLELHLSLDETRVLRGGQGDVRAHIDELELIGNVSYAVDPEAGPTRSLLQLRAKGLGAVAKELQISDYKLEGTITSDIDQFRLAMNSVKPESLALSIKRTTLASFVLTLPRN